MIKLGNTVITFEVPEDWDFSESPWEMKSVTIKISGESYTFSSVVSFDGNDSPLEFFSNLSAKSHANLHWQSMCEDIYLKSRYEDEEFHVSVEAHRDCDESGSHYTLELSLVLNDEHISINMARLNQLFGGLRAV